MWLVTKLHQERQHPVVLIARVRDDPSGDFALNGHHHSFRATCRLRQFNQDGRGGGIGKVGHHFPAAPVARLASEELQGVVVNEEKFLWCALGEPASRCH